MTKLFINNRGEIAVRVIRAAQELGIGTVLGASEADAHSQGAQLADEVAILGAPEPAQSYLRMDGVVQAALDHGCDAMHPGYGFLSERAEFAALCAEAGITFVGPSPEAMRKLGGKIDAKSLAVACGVPVTPGHFAPGATDQELKDAAARIGYPVMLKASAGGGGRGMRVVLDPSEFDSALHLAREESERAFGDGAMMLEKLVLRPRHIEVQVLADLHGNVAALFERECSLQRRHQKVVEEAPSPVVDEALWHRLRSAAVSLVRAAGYTNAGTVEFILDPATRDFYFLEVNARLQVEHPVTELITGVDLVQWQLRIARGERLTLPAALMEGDRTAVRGHAMEARLLAEDPARGFLPSVGRLVGWAPAQGPGIRFDTGFGSGDEVSRYYDSMLAKLIVHAGSRPEATRRLDSALADTHILGVKTNIAYLRDVLAHPDFAAFDFDTGWLGRAFGDWSGSEEIPSELGAIAGVAKVGGGGQSRSAGADRTEYAPAWALADGWKNLR